MSAVEAWREDAVRPERSGAADRGRPAGPRRPAEGRRPGEGRRPPVPRGGTEYRGEPQYRAEPQYRGSSDRRPAAQQRQSTGQRRDLPARGTPRADPTASDGGSLRGALGVLGVFVITLVGGAIDSFMGVGLGIITLVALVGSTAVAALMVRRRDLGSVLVAPPLVFVAVAMANIGLAPSATFSLPTIATLLIRGFPAMAIAVTVALVITLARVIARR